MIIEHHVLRDSNPEIAGFVICLGTAMVKVIINEWKEIFPLPYMYIAGALQTLNPKMNISRDGQLTHCC